MNKLQWNSKQNWKLFIHGNTSEYIVCEMTAILSRVGGVGGGLGGGGGCGAVCVCVCGGVGGGGGGNWTRISMLSDRRNAFSILMFGLIFTSCIGTFTQWHWIEYLNIIDVMVWFSLAAITWAQGNQYFTCCYEATMNSSASAWSVYEMVAKEGYSGWTGYSS